MDYPASLYPIKQRYACHGKTNDDKQAISEHLQRFPEASPPGAEIKLAVIPAE